MHASSFVCDMQPVRKSSFHALLLKQQSVIGCVQWLGRLPKDVKEQKLQEVMDLMADGTIKPPPARKLF